MELRRLISILLSRLWLIALATVLVAAPTYYLSATTTPTYQATAVVLINQGADPTNDPYNSLLSSTRIASTYVEQMKSSRILARVIQELNLPLTVSKLSGMVTVAQVRDTQLVSISVEDEKKERAQVIANDIAGIFIEENNKAQQARFQSSRDDLQKQIADVTKKMDNVQTQVEGASDATARSRLEMEMATYQSQYSVLLKSLQDLNLAATRYMDTVTIFSPADLPITTIKPRTTLNTGLGILVGLILGIIAAFLLEYLDDTVKSADDVARVTGLSTLARIVRVPHARQIQDALITSQRPDSALAEGYASLRVALQFSELATTPASVVVVSAKEGEGKTTTAANLAIALAQSGKRVVLVDTDLRAPALHTVFGISLKPGLTDLLIMNGKDPNAAARETSIRNLRLVTAGTRVIRPAEVLSRPALASILEALKQQADIIILDSPPLLLAPDAILLAAKARNVLWAIRSGVSRRDALRRSRQALAPAEATNIGVVLTQVTNSPGYNYYYSESNAGEKAAASAPLRAQGE